MSFKQIPVFLVKIPVHFYRLVLSPWLPRSCRYHPTCSAYMLEAIDKHGAVKGGWLGLKRLGRCHPFCRRDYEDPVP